MAFNTESRYQADITLQSKHTVMYMTNVTNANEGHTMSEQPRKIVMNK
jgi:hypothetical protein